MSGDVAKVVGSASRQVKIRGLVAVTLRHWITNARASVGMEAATGGSRDQFILNVGYLF